MQNLRWHKNIFICHHSTSNPRGRYSLKNISIIIDGKDRGLLMNLISGIGDGPNFLILSPDYCENHEMEE